MRFVLVLKILVTAPGGFMSRFLCASSKSFLRMAKRFRSSSAK